MAGVCRVLGHLLDELVGQQGGPGLAVARSSYLNSGHNQGRDNITCVPQPLPVVGPCHPDSLTENDPNFSWVTRAVTKLNKNVPAEWRYLILLVAQSGATTRQMFEQGQIDSVTQAVAARGRTWSIISFTGGANNPNFGLTLADFYGKHFPLERLKPWQVKNWSDCPDTQALYNRLVNQESTIRSDLAEIVARGRAASPSVRFVDMMYPYVLKSDNVCRVDRQTPDPNDLTKFLVWRGAGSVIDKLNSLHMELTGCQAPDFCSTLSECVTFPDRLAIISS